MRNCIILLMNLPFPMTISHGELMLDHLEFNVMLALIMMLVSGHAYQWRPEIDVSDPFVLSTLFADGAH